MNQDLKGRHFADVPEVQRESLVTLENFLTRPGIFGSPLILPLAIELTVFITVLHVDIPNKVRATRFKYKT
jgi:hypothetical protein